MRTARRSQNRRPRSDLLAHACLARLRPVLAALALLLAPAAQAAPSPATAAQRRDHAAKLEANHDYAGAIQEYQAAYQQDEGAAPDDAATDLNSIGIDYHLVGDYAKAIDFYQRALPLYISAGDKDGQARDLMDTGNISHDLSQPAKAIDLYQQALPLLVSAGDRDGQATDLTGLGSAYDALSQPAKAIGYYQQALPLYISVGDRVGQARDLMDTGLAYDHLGRPADALPPLQQALPLYVRAGDRAGQATDLLGTGLAYSFLGRPVDELVQYQQALPLLVSVGNVSVEAAILGNLMDRYLRQGHPRLAIFYGKQAVNAYQTFRGGLQKLDQQTQQTSLTSVSIRYGRLAALLIKEGRLLEAQQVLRLLKQQEFYDFLNPSQGPPTPPLDLDTLGFTPHEKTWLDAYDKALAAAQDPKDQAAQRDYTALLARMAADFARPPTAADALPDTAQADELAAALTPGTVAVYTIVAPDRLYLIVLAPGRPAQARHTDITTDALYQKVRAFRWALTDPTVDPTPLAAELYHLLFGPIQKDLDDAHAATVLFSLDDALRYLPLAALYDDHAHQYVVQRYATALITLAAPAPPAPPAPADPAVLAAGVSLSLDGLPPLPGVKEELDAIVRPTGDATVPPDGPAGLLPGTRLLDPAFTRPALLDGLGAGRYPYVHLASHFALHPTDTDSYLLLGDGTHLSVADLRHGHGGQKLDGPGGGGAGGAGAAAGGALGAGVAVAGVGRGDAGADGRVLRADAVAPGLAAAARLAAGAALDAGRHCHPVSAARSGGASGDGDGRPAFGPDAGAVRAAGGRPLRPPVLLGTLRPHRKLALTQFRSTVRVRLVPHWRMGADLIRRGPV